MNEALYLSLKQSGASDEVLRDLKKRDKIKLTELMNSAITNMLKIVPTKFRNLLTFNNWETAEKEITKIIKSRK